MSAATDTDHISAAARIPFDRLPFSELFKDYCRGEPRIWSYFPNGNSIADAEVTALAAARKRPVDRPLLCHVLEEQNRSWNCGPETLRSLGILEQPTSVCAVTGQQLGLFVSPLYTIYKAITAVQLAQKWRSQGQPATPIFWLADEDHDFDEVAATYLPKGEAVARVGMQSDHATTPVGRRLLDERIRLVEEALADALPVAPFRDEVLTAVHDAYRPGTTHRAAFATLLHRLLPDSGLIIMSADDARLKRHATRLFEMDIADAELFSLLTARSEALAEDYHAQIRPRDTNLFYLGDDSRTVIDRTPDGFSAGDLENWTYDSLREEIAARPEAFSPNVVLRPVMQDMLLPTAAYVAGPGELAYYAQIAPAYAWAGVEMPLVKPRASLSLADNASLRLIQQRSFTLDDLARRPEQLFAAEVRRGMPPDIHGAFERSRRELNNIADGLAHVATGVDPTLGRTAEAARTQLLKQADRLLSKVDRAERRKHEELRRRLAHAQGLLFPAGGLQERTVSPLYFAARFGMGFFSRLTQHISLDTTEHQLFAASEV